MIGFIIGNGPSRKDFDLFSLEGKGLIIGCNALYRDPNPAHYIVAVDNGMAQELNNKYDGKVIVQNNGLGPGNKAQFLFYTPKFRGKARSSGGLATDFAVFMGIKTIYWIGFDNPKSTPFPKASIYAGTPNYTRNNSWGYTCFIEEYKTLLTHHKNVEFINVVKPSISNYMINELGHFKNYSVLEYSDFLEFLEKCPCSSVDLEHMATNYSVGGSNPSKGSS